MSRKFLYVFVSLMMMTTLLLTAYTASPKTPTSIQPINNPVEDATPTPDTAEVETPTPETGKADTPAAGSTSGTMLADLGFRPDKDGFAFENYGPGNTNLTPEEMNKIYGDSVCANKVDGKCNLVPPAQQWMEQINSAMEGGHCYGMAQASMLMFQKVLSPSDFGGTTISDLKVGSVGGNEKLARQIAQDWSGQTFGGVRAGVIKGTPNEITAKLIDLLKAGPSGDQYVIAFFKRDNTGGHAVTPYAVEDRGNGKVAIMVYDNNYPAKAREMLVDTNKDTWQYEASPNPSIKSVMYEGDATTQSLMLYPIPPALKQQNCDFCASSGSAKTINGLAKAEVPMNQIFLEGKAELLIADKDGHKLGRVNGKMVSEIPGARYEIMLVDSYASDVEPTYFVPAELDLYITLDGSKLKTKSASDVVIIGPGYDVGVEGVELKPGQKDELIFLTKDESLAYITKSSESPTFIIGLQRDGADYEFDVKGAEMVGGGTIIVMMDTKAGDLVVNASEIKKDAKIGIYMNRIDDKTEESFGNDEVVLKADHLLLVQYAEWKGNGEPLTMYVTNDKGDVIDTYTSADE